MTVDSRWYYSSLNVVEVPAGIGRSAAGFDDPPIRVERPEGMMSVVRRHATALSICVLLKESQAR